MNRTIIETCPPLFAMVDRPEISYSWWRLQAPFRRLRQYGVKARSGWFDDDGNCIIYPNEITVLPRITQVAGKDNRPFIQAVTSNSLVTVYEADDDIFTASLNDHLIESDWLQGNTPESLEEQRVSNIRIMAACDGVTTTNENLARMISTFTDKPVVVVPNFIDVRSFESTMVWGGPFPDKLTIGWAGGRRPGRDLDVMARAWATIEDKYPEVYFVVAGHVPDVVFQHVRNPDRVIIMPGLPITEYGLNYQVDIGCCAVADTEYNRRKSPIKYMEYALAGAAVVGTTALYGTIIQDGKTGLIADTHQEWVDALSLLIEEKHEREHLAMMARADVKTNHSLDENLWRWPAAYQHILWAKASR